MHLKAKKNCTPFRNGMQCTQIKDVNYIFKTKNYEIGPDLFHDCPGSQAGKVLISTLERFLLLPLCTELNS